MTFLRRHFLIFAPCIFLLGILLTRLFSFVACIIITSALLFVSVLLAVLTKINRCSVLPLILCFLLSFALIIGTCDRIPERRLEKYHGEQVDVAFTVRRILYSSSTSVTATGWLDEINGTPFSATVRIILSGTSDITPGSVITANAEIALPSHFSNATSAKYAAAQGQVAFLYVSDTPQVLGTTNSLILQADALNARLCQRIREKLPGESGEVTCALLLGDQSGLSSSFQRDMTRIGTAHMLALSGMNVNLLVLGLYHILQKLHVHKKICYFILIPLTLAYMLLTGLSPSVLRAGFMTIFLLLSFLCGRVHYSFSALFVSVAVICALAPETVLSMSLWLSAAATLGILLFMHRVTFDKKRSGLLQSVGQALLLSLGITLAASIATLPLSAYLFGRFPLLSLPANLILAPLFDLIVYLGVILLFLPFSFPPFLLVCDFVGGSAIRLATLLSALPNTQLSLRSPLLFIAAVALSTLILLYTVIRQKQNFRLRVPLLLLVCFALVCTAEQGATAICCRQMSPVDYATMTQGGGDILILRPMGYTAVIDISKGGEDAVRFATDRLNNAGRYEIDSYIITDYTSSLPMGITYLCENEVVRSFYLPKPSLPQEKKVYQQVEQLLLSYGITLICYNTGEDIFFPQFRFVLDERLRLPKDSASSICLTVDAGQKKLTYASASCFATPLLYSALHSAMATSQYLIFGAYGRCEHDSAPFFLTPKEGVTIFSPKEELCPLPSHTAYNCQLTKEKTLLLGR